MACVVAPLHGFALPRTPSPSRTAPVAATPHLVPEQPLRPEGLAVPAAGDAAFALYALHPVRRHLQSAGDAASAAGSSAATVVTLGALFGPAQVAARLVDFLLAGRTHPLWIARGAIALMAVAFAMLAFVGISVAGGRRCSASRSAPPTA